MPKSTCRPHWSLTQELNALDDKKAVVGMSVIDNLNASHTTYWRFWSKVLLLLLLWWGMRAHGPGLCSWVAKWCQNLGAAALNTQNSLAVVDLLSVISLILAIFGKTPCCGFVYVTQQSVYG